MARIWNAITQQYEEQADSYEPIILSEAEKEALYKHLVATFIEEQYSPSREAGLQNDAMAAMLMNQPIPEGYLALLEYREACKDRAYLEVYGIARG